MVAPIDYSIDVESPFEAGIKGMQLASFINEQQLKQQQQQAQMEQQKQRQQILSRWATLPPEKMTFNDVMQIGMILPKDQAEALAKTIQTLEPKIVESELGFSGQVLSALISPEGAQYGINLLNQRAEAERNSGNEGKARQYEMLAKSAEANPQMTFKMLAPLITKFPGGDKVVENVLKIHKAPAEVTEAEAKATKAAVEAKFAESNAAIDLEKKGWDIQKIQSDMQVSKQNANIAAVNAQIAREGNALKREELGLKVDEMKMKRDQTVRDIATEAFDKRVNINNSLATIDKLLKTPASVTEAVIGAPLYAKLPTLGEDRAEYEDNLDILGSQLTMANIDKMKGVLSDSDLKVLRQASLGVTLRQNPVTRNKNLQETQRLLLKAHKRVAEKFGVPDVPIEVPTGESGAPAPSAAPAAQRNVTVNY